MRDRELSPQLRAGRRALDGLDGFTLLRDWEWSESYSCWTLHCRLSPELPLSDMIPNSTDWYVLVDEKYPRGALKFVPAKLGGIVQTFPHQNYNDVGNSDDPWRRGDLCLATSVHLLGRHGINPEPTHPDWRLRWHAERAIEWLVSAATDQLLVDGDPFELPRYPGVRGDPYLVFSEGVTAFEDWKHVSDRYGLVRLGVLGENPTAYIVRSFCSRKFEQLIVPRWGARLSGRFQHEELGIWMKLDSIPVIDPWQAPKSWGELREVCRDRGLDLFGMLRLLLPEIRDGNAHNLLIGFPISERIGDPPSQFHWQAIRLPVVSFGSRVRHGFRENETGYWTRDCLEVFAADRELVWLDSQNWHPDQLTRRGKLPLELTERRIGILGAGAVGSILASMLVRAGVQDLVILDDDKFQAGNLARHTLNLLDVGKPKAIALADQLNSESPHANVTPIEFRFPNIPEQHRSMVQGCDIIIDCTAENEALHALEEFSWDSDRLFCSLSVSLNAERLYCFLARGRSFPKSVFDQALHPWLEQSSTDYVEDSLPWEGIGCWHPVFPARVDTIWMLVSGAVQVLSNPKVLNVLNDPELIVLERVSHDNAFAGVVVVHHSGVA